VTLRLYAPTDAKAQAVVSVKRGGVVTPLPGILTPVNGVAFASIEIPAGAQARTETATVTVLGLNVKVWGVVTVTDNVTQQVAAFWPQ